MSKTTLREHFWIWGHPTNTLKDYPSNISPTQGVEYIGAKNLYYNDYIESFNKEKECELAKGMAQVGWCIDCAASHPENVTEICEMAKKYKNIKIGMFDDFFAGSNPPNNYTNYTPELLRKYKEELHAAGVEIWSVIYTENFRQLDMSVIKKYIGEFDGVSLWFWNEEEVANDYDKYVDLFLELTPNQKHMIGCYIFNFAEHKPADGALVKYQLEKGTELIKNGMLDGFIVHSNIAFGLNPPHKAVEECKIWLDNHGDDEIIIFPNILQVK